MRHIKDRYWLMFIGWKLVALGVYFVTGFSLLLVISLLTSIPWWLYVLKIIGGPDEAS